MATTGIDNCSPYRMACTECNDLLVAPRWSAYVSKHEVRHFWSCENCGHEIEVTVNPRINFIEIQPGRWMVGREQSRSADDVLRNPITGIASSVHAPQAATPRRRQAA
jgi:hypothetical protein